MLDRFTGYADRRERLITVARVILAVVSVLALTLDPSDPPRFARFVYGAVLAYTGYAIVAAIRARRADAFKRWWPLASHVTDLGSALILIRFTEGSGSPFLVYLLFPLLPATLRWRWRGTVWTAALVLAGLVGIAVNEVVVLHEPRFELNALMLRMVYVVVLAVILGYMAAYEEQSRRAIVRVTTWTVPTTVEEQPFLAGLLGHVAETLDAPRVLLIWRATGAAATNVAQWVGGYLQLSTDDLSTWANPVPDPIRNAHFLSPDAGAARPSVLYTSATGLKRWQGEPVTRAVRTRFSIRSLLVLRLHGNGFSGRLFLLDKRHMRGDDLMLGALVAGRVQTSLEQRILVHSLRDAAASDERVRVARDVHDDVLQSLTALSLGLETVRRLIERAPARAQEWVSELQSRLATEQGTLRSSLRGLRRGASPPRDLAVQLSELVEQIEQEWRLPVKLDLALQHVTIPGAIGQEIHRIVREAVVNAARHAHASAVRVALRCTPGEVRITVTDDGVGFPFRGQYDDAGRRQRNLGPVVLAERVEALDGTLAIASSAHGARLDIRIPLA